MLNATAIHADLAKRLLRFYPQLINDIYISDEYYGKFELSCDRYETRDCHRNELNCELKLCCISFTRQREIVHRISVTDKFPDKRLENYPFIEYRLRNGKLAFPR